MYGIYHLSDGVTAKSDNRQSVCWCVYALFHLYSSVGCLLICSIRRYIFIIWSHIRNDLSIYIYTYLIIMSITCNSLIHSLITFVWPITCASSIFTSVFLSLSLFIRYSNKLSLILFLYQLTSNPSYFQNKYVTTVMCKICTIHRRQMTLISLVINGRSSVEPLLYVFFFCTDCVHKL